jgi:very-short-patch-repair endonuclease
LQRGQLDGLSFRRQHPIGRYIVDFYCPAIRLAVEVDGGQHNERRNQLFDRRRSQWLSTKGVTMVRFWNNDVLNNIEGVWEEIARIADALRLRPATPTPTLPLLGGGS